MYTVSRPDEPEFVYVTDDKNQLLYGHGYGFVTQLKPVILRNITDPDDDPRRAGGITDQNNYDTNSLPVGARVEIDALESLYVTGFHSLIVGAKEIPWRVYVDIVHRRLQILETKTRQNVESAEQAAAALNSTSIDDALSKLEV